MRDSLCDDDNYLELSREREKIYTLKSVERWWEALNYFAETGRDIPNSKVLDVGTSPFTFLLNDLFSEVTSLDLTDHLKKRCLENEITFVEGGLSDDMPQIPDKHFDCIYCLEVLEHIHVNPVEVLRELRGKLSEGGILILSTPNMACMGNRVRLIFNRKLLHYTYPPYSDNPCPIHGHRHDRVFMPHELLDYAMESGFSKSKLKYHLRYPPFSDVNFYNPRKWPGLLLRSVFPSLRSITVLIAEKWESKCKLLPLPN